MDRYKNYWHLIRTLCLIVFIVKNTYADPTTTTSTTSERDTESTLLTACQHLNLAENRRAKSLQEEQDSNNITKHHKKQIFVPKCTKYGEFERMQCFENECWCVDEYGLEIFGTKQIITNETDDSSLQCSAELTNINQSVNANCPASSCRMFCPSGFVRDLESGCHICQCRDPCEGIECPNGLTCEQQEVKCKNEPCPPIPTCKRARTLQDLCPAGEPLLITDSQLPFLCGNSPGKPVCPPLYKCLLEMGNDYGVCCPSKMMNFEKPGICPKPIDYLTTKSQGTLCGTPCETDLECPQMQKCCYNSNCGGKNCHQPSMNLTNCHQIKMLSEILSLNDREGRGYIPECNGPDGIFSKKQCSRNGLVCWCVDIYTGHKIKDSMNAAGMVNCENFEMKTTAVSQGRSINSYKIQQNCDKNICAAICEYGFKNDHNGCETCECSEPCEGFQCPSGSHCEILKDLKCTSQSSFCASEPLCKPDLVYSNPCDVGTPLSDNLTGEIFYCEKDVIPPEKNNFQSRSFFSSYDDDVESKETNRQMTNYRTCPINYKCTKLFKESKNVCCPKMNYYSATPSESVPELDRQKTMCEYLRDFPERMEGTEDGMILALKPPTCDTDGHYKAVQCKDLKMKIPHSKQQYTRNGMTIQEDPLNSISQDTRTKRYVVQECALYKCRPCENGFKVDPVTGCQMGCECLPSSGEILSKDCPVYRCRGCEFGFKYDEKGCMTCECLPSPTTDTRVKRDTTAPAVPPLECALYKCRPCEDGFKIKFNPVTGCQMGCDCFPSNVEVSPIDCPVYRCRGCEFGFKYDEKGCMTCECLPPPSTDTRMKRDTITPTISSQSLKPLTKNLKLIKTNDNELMNSLLNNPINNIMMKNSPVNNLKDFVELKTSELNYYNNDNNYQLRIIADGKNYGSPSATNTNNFVEVITADIDEGEDMIQIESNECWCVDGFGTEIPDSRGLNVTEASCKSLRQGLECLDITCRMGCDYGFVLDPETKCPTCECRDPCDSVECLDNQECRSVEVSCEGEYCPPVPTCLPKKLGQCPFLVPPGTDGSTVDECEYECQSDFHCNGTQKCCSNGCGTQCTEPQLKTACQHLQTIQLHQASELGVPARQKYIAQCHEHNGSFKIIQCGPNNVCWCVDEEGKELSGTRTVNKKPDCSKDARKHCPIHKCQINTNCQHGFVLDGNGCKTCDCYDPCSEIICPRDEQCKLMKIECIDYPCPEMPLCMPIRESKCSEGIPLRINDREIICGPQNNMEQCPTTHTCQYDMFVNSGVCCSKTRDVCFESINSHCIDRNITKSDIFAKWRFSPKHNKCVPVKESAIAITTKTCSNRNMFHTEAACKSVCPALTQCERLRLKNSMIAKQSRQQTVWFQPRCDVITGSWQSVQCLGELQPDQQKQLIDEEQQLLASASQSSVNGVSRAFSIDQPSSIEINKKMASTSICWCSDKKGAPIKGSLVRGSKPICNHRQARKRLLLNDNVHDGINEIKDPIVEELIRQITIINDDNFNIDDTIIENNDIITERHLYNNYQNNYDNSDDDIFSNFETTSVTERILNLKNSIYILDDEEHVTTNDAGISYTDELPLSTGKNLNRRLDDDDNFDNYDGNDDEQLLVNSKFHKNKKTITTLTSSPIMTRCRAMQQKQTVIDSFNVSCDEDGKFLPIQCNSDDICWCVDEAGNQLASTNTFYKTSNIICKFTPIDSVSIELQLMNGHKKLIPNLHNVIKTELLKLLNFTPDNLHISESPDLSTVQLKFDLIDTNKIDKSYLIEEMVKENRFLLANGNLYPDITLSKFIHNNNNNSPLTIRSNSRQAKQYSPSINDEDNIVSNSAITNSQSNSSSPSSGIPATTFQTIIFILATTSAFLVSILVVYIMLKRGKNKMKNYHNNKNIGMGDKFLDYSSPIFVLSTTPAPTTNTTSSSPSTSSSSSSSSSPSIPSSPSPSTASTSTTIVESISNRDKSVE